MTAPLHPGPGETLDRLARDWWIFQLEAGHRYSTDDVLTAWAGARAVSGARRVLDLGSGVGSVGLLVLGCLGDEARLLSVEAQRVSADLARRTVAHNGLEERVEVRCADLRSPTALEAGERFDLVVANPPYLAPEASLRSPHPQRANARLELRGDIFDYCRVASEHLAEHGRFCFSHAAKDPRPHDAVRAAGLRILSRQEIVFRQDRPPTIALYVCGEEGSRTDPAPLVVRDRAGRRTPEFVEARRLLGMDA